MDLTSQSLLGISGSIRSNASSTMVLNWLGKQTGIESKWSLYNKLQTIPPFDGSERLPAAVEEFIADIRSADAVIFCSPEYAHGLSGVLKNALDWTVASDVWISKPVAVITAAGQGEHAHASLLEVLKTMSAELIPAASLIIPFVKSKLNADGEILDEPTRQQLQRLSSAVRDYLRKQKKD